MNEATATVTTGRENQQKDKDDTYGNWMIVQSKNPFSHENKQRIKGDKGNKLPHPMKQTTDLNQHSPPKASGSCFAAIFMDDGEADKLGIMKKEENP